jgi:diketogulonate reductase-like aldo/keto reductase
MARLAASGAVTGAEVLIRGIMADYRGLGLGKVHREEILSSRRGIDTMPMHLLDRRQFGARCAAYSLGVPVLDALLAAPATAEVPGSGAESKSVARTVKLPDGTVVPALGQGCWHLGEGRHAQRAEEDALRLGISLGMSVIDTAENYGGGRSEEIIGRVIAGQREQVFLVSKVEPENALAVARACAASLARLRTDYLDLYLLHAPVPGRQLAGVVAEFERLRAAGKVRAWGVSNFNVGQMEDLFRVPDGQRCAINQVPYSINNRRIESDVLPWCTQHNVPVMAYSPLGGDKSALLRDPKLTQLAATYGCSVAALVLAWVIRSGNVIAIPESGSAAHVRENAVALTLKVS